MIIVIPFVFVMIADVSFRKIESLARLFVPQILLLFLFIINLSSFPVPYAGIIKPDLVLMAVYYWAIYRPTLVPPLLCFLLGLFLDILSGMPPGLNAFVLVSVQWVVRDQRRFLMGQPYITIWAVYGLVALAASFAEWGLFGFVHMHWTSLVPVFSGVLISLFLFPFITLLLVFTHRLLPVASRPLP